MVGNAVVRGGGFLDSKLGLRTHFRRPVLPTVRSDNIGFRCAYSAPEAVVVPRGELTPPADEGREPWARPRAALVPGPEVLAEGLVTPMGITHRHHLVCCRPRRR